MKAAIDFTKFRGLEDFRKFMQTATLFDLHVFTMVLDHAAENMKEEENELTDALYDIRRLEDIARITGRKLSMEEMNQDIRFLNERTAGLIKDKIGLHLHLHEHWYRDYLMRYFNDGNGDHIDVREKERLLKINEEKYILMFGKDGHHGAWASFLAFLSDMKEKAKKIGHAHEEELAAYHLLMQNESSASPAL